MQLLTQQLLNMLIEIRRLYRIATDIGTANSDRLDLSPN
jgi:hypothetical protein